MAMGNFLDMGQSTGSAAQSSIQPIAQSTAQQTSTIPQGMSWQDIARLLVQYGSRPGSSGPAIANAAGTYNKAQPTQMMTTPQEDNAQKNSNSTGAALSAILSLIGI